MTIRVTVSLCLFMLAISTCVRGQISSNADRIRPALVSPQSRSRIVGNDTRQTKVPVYTPPEAVDQQSARKAYAPIKLEPVQVGTDLIRGYATAEISEIVIEIRSNDLAARSGRNITGSGYSHTTSIGTQPMAYRIRHFSGSHDSRAWQFTLRLSKPLTEAQEVRAIPNGNDAEGTVWLRANSSTSPVVLTQDNADRSTLRSEVVITDRSQMSRSYPQRPSRRMPAVIDPCQGNALRINIDWATGSVSPVQLKRSGDYCVTLSDANTVLYSYSIRVEAEEIQGNPLELLGAASDALGKIVGTGTPPKTDKVAGALKALTACDSVSDLISDVKGKSADLRGAFNALLPGETGGKIDSIPLDTTLKAWGPVQERFENLAPVAKTLRDQKNLHPECVAQVEVANTILAEFDTFQAKYLYLLDRVNDPLKGTIRLSAGYLDAADNTKITIKEYYGVRETNAKDLALKVPAGYHPISASAGFLVTQVPARTYSSRTAPDPANPTATQNVLGVDYGAGMRPALTALLHYNLPFKQERQFGLALTAGPVYDISGGKADTSKFGFFGGISARFSRWLYVTPGFHIGEFADFPQGFTRTGQVIPANTGTPVPNKRYTTRFGLAVTYKIKDLGVASPPPAK